MNKTLELQIQNLQKIGKFELESVLKVVSEYYTKLEREIKLQKESVELLHEELQETNQKIKTMVQNQLQTILNNIKEGIVFLSKNFEVVFANKASFEIFHLNFVKLEEEKKILQEILNDIISQIIPLHENLNKPLYLDYVREGRAKHLEISLTSTVFFEETGTIVSIRDVTKEEEEKIYLRTEKEQLKAQLKESQSTIENLSTNLKEEFSGRRMAEATLEFLAYYDPLTGLMNQSSMKKIINNYIQEDPAPFALVYIDLVKFKIFNDSLGHHIGDEILKLISLRLLENLPKQATLFRIGGDEFILFIKEIKDRLYVARLCKSIIKRFQKNFTLYGLEFHIDLHLGIAIFPNDGNDLESLLRSADTALSVAREKVGSHAKFYSQKMSLNVYEQLIMANRLKTVIQRGELEIFYQPKFSLEQNKILGFEALLRWNQPEIGYISPDKFIPLAEQNGTIIPIGEWSINEVCKQIREWNSLGFDFSVAINLSPIQFLRENIHREIARILQNNKVLPNQIELEITESGVMKNLEYAVKALNSLHEIGVKISIDDFGTGYSSLSHLKQFPIHKIKIDRSFIQDVPQNKKDNAIVKAIIDMANHLELATIAEGVETKAQLEFLKQIGCKEVQGYYISKPLQSSAIVSFIDHFHSHLVGK